FGEGDVDELAVDLRAHGHGVERFGGADAVEIDRHVGRARGRRQHRNRIGRRRAAAAAAPPEGLHLLVRLRAGGGADFPGDHQCADQQNGYAPLERHCLMFAIGGAGGRNQPPPSAWNRLSTALKRARWSTTSVFSAWNKVCWTCSRVTRSMVPSRSLVSESSKARRELSTTWRCSRSVSAVSATAISARSTSPNADSTDLR